MCIFSTGYAIGLALVGRYAVVVAYNSGVQYAAELVPVQVQAGGVAAIHVAGYAASILSSQVLYLVSTSGLFKQEMNKCFIFSGEIFSLHA